MINRIAQTSADKEAYEKIIGESESIKDDFYDYSKVVVRKPWGYEYLLYENDSVAVWILYLKDGAQTSMHCHPNKKTSLIVLEGNVVCSSLGSENPRSVGQGMVIEKGVFHQTTCKNQGGAFVMEVETPVNKRDLLRLKDKYGRQNLGYESSDSYSGNTQNYNYLSLIDTDFTCNQKKRFGKCTMTLRRLEHAKNFEELANLNEDDAICILSGQIFNGPDLLMDTADTLTVKEILARRSNLAIKQPIEILVIRRMDHITKVSDYITNFFKKKDFFFVPGDANVHLLDSLGRTEGAHFSSFFTEKSASFAAEAYAKTSNQAPVLVVSSGGSGPASLPGVANAWVDSAPMIVISGQARSDQSIDSSVRQLGNKSLNIIEMVKPITKYAAKLTEAHEIRYHLEKAAYMATEGRPGPVWLDIPIDIQSAIVDESELNTFDPQKEIQVNRSSKKLEEPLQKVQSLLMAAERPVLLLGHGAQDMVKDKKLITWIENLGIPVVLTRRGCDLIPENHPLFFGRAGAYGQRRANFVIQNSDLLLSIGARLSIPLVGRNHRSFVRKAKKIVVDIDAHELKKNTISIDCPIQASAQDFMEGFDQHIGRLQGKLKIENWISQCQTWRESFPVKKEYNVNGKFLSPYLFISELSRQAPDNAIIVADGGAVTNFMMQTFEFKSNQKMILSTGLELPGFALAGSIGASLAAKRAPVICLCEDLGFQSALSELQTVLNEHTPIKFFVFTSQGSLAIRNIQKDFFGSRFVGTDIETTYRKIAPLKQVARDSGYKDFEIKTHEEMGQKIQNILETREASFCEVHIDPHQELIPRPGFVIKEDGKWIAKPIEDMYPFMDAKQLKANMIIDLAAED